MFYILFYAQQGSFFTLRNLFIAPVLILSKNIARLQRKQNASNVAFVSAWKNWRVLFEFHNHISSDFFFLFRLRAPQSTEHIAGNCEY